MVCSESVGYLNEASTVLETGARTGLTLFPEEVQILCTRLDHCRAHMEGLMDEW